MDRLASMLPEYELVMGMEGIGKVTGPQLMAEVGDVRRFSHKGGDYPKFCVNLLRGVE